MEEPFSPKVNRTRAIVAGALVCWLGFALIAWWQESGASTAFDRAGILLWRDYSSPDPVGPAWVTDAMRAITMSGDGEIRIVLALAVLGALAFYRHWREAITLLAIILPAAAICSALKAIFARPRPDFVPYLGDFQYLSFPSGHSFNGAATYLGLAVIAGALLPRRRTALLAAGVLLSLAIAFSRVWLGVHYPSDVIAGWLGGAGWVLIMVWLRDRIAL